MSNRNAWLDLLSYAEGTMRNGRRAYNIYYGGGTYDNTKDHPDIVLTPTPNSISSSAAGAFQFMPGTWEGLGGGPMTAARQDEGAIRLAAEKGVNLDTDPINAANVARLAPVWASLPTLEGVSYYPPQRSKPFRELAEFLGKRGFNVDTNQYIDPYSKDALGAVDSFDSTGDQSALPEGTYQKTVSPSEKEVTVAEMRRIMGTLMPSSEAQKPNPALKAELDKETEKLKKDNELIIALEREKRLKAREEAAASAERDAINTGLSLFANETARQKEAMKAGMDVAIRAFAA